MLAFLVGSFVANFTIEYYIKKGKSAAHKYPIFLEMTILFIVGAGGNTFSANSMSETVMACIVLFSMGVQNSLVTQISRIQFLFKS